MRLRQTDFRAPWELTDMDLHTPVLVGLSGGADSVALLHLLAARAARDGFSLIALHVHHGIRGEEADRDETFCRAFAGRLGVAFLSVRVDVPQLARARGESLEETARAERYRAFGCAMRERGIPLLATAHHAGDNAETVLFRLCRGSGLHGLGGIPQVRVLERDLLVTRPLLPYTKADILEYCKEMGLDYVTDSTNLLPDCTRNRLRLEILPLLERSIPGATENIARAAAHLREDDACLSAMADDWRMAHTANGFLTLDHFSNLHKALRTRVLRGFLDARLETIHVAEVERLCLSGKGGTVPLPGDRFASVLGGRLAVFPHLRGDGLHGIRPFGTEPFALCDGKLTVSARHIEKCGKIKKIHNLSTIRYIIQSEKSVIINRLFWRALQPGDRMTVGDRSVRCVRLLQARGIPAPVRRFLPVLCNADGAIVWLPFASAEGRAEDGGIEVTVSLAGADEQIETENRPTEE